MQKYMGCHVMAKPSGSVCNIDCEYCFYLEKDKLYPERQNQWKMTDKTLEAFIKQHIAAQPGDTVEFAWQGGEPTLLGIDFYYKVVELCTLYAQGKTIYHAFQTNGILLNDEWCRLFKQHNFLIGISIDGPADLHDYYRVTRSGKPTHQKVIHSIELLKQHGIEFNTLTVINAQNVHHPLRVYEFLKNIGSNFLQFIPIVERQPEQSKGTAKHNLASPDQPFASVTSWSVTPQDYGKFLTTIFDYWVRHDVGTTFVQTFDATLSSWFGGHPGLCIFAKNCGHAFALEANGDLYQCDHYVYPEYKLGNIHNTDIKDLNQSLEAITFGQAKSETLNTQCQRCSYLHLCHGGCPKHRFERGPSGKIDHNYLCSGYYHYFQHTESAMKTMAKLLQHQRPASQIMGYLAQQKQQIQQQAEQQNIQRNDPCPCGSGKKHKKCCQ